MKKYLFFVLCTFFSFSLFSQTLVSAEETEKKETEETTLSEHREKKFAVNVFYNPATFIYLKETSPSVGNFFGGDIMYHTSKTYHYVGYDLLQNAITTTNGYLITDHIGSYVFFSNSFNKKFEEGEILSNKALSAGLEYFFESKYVDLIFYSEFGTDFSELKHSFKENFFSIGMIFEGHTFKF